MQESVESLRELMMKIILLLLFLVEVHCQQTYPYVSFSLTGQTLVNHSYVDLSTVGSASDNSDSVVCHTDLESCCSGSQGIHRGDWSFPDGTPPPSHVEEAVWALRKVSRTRTLECVKSSLDFAIHGKNLDLVPRTIHYVH